MPDLVNSLTTELRITGRIFRETLMGIHRTGWMNIIILVTMASILTIFGVVFAMIMELGTLIQSIGSELQISAYVADGTDIRDAAQRVHSLPHIQKITLIPKEKAWADMQSELPFPDVENPLPDTLHIQMDNETYIPQTVARLKDMKEILHVQYPKKELSRIRYIAQWVSLAGMVVSFILGALTLFIISNTIHLLIQNKSREIEILRMMGVGNWYIRLPFLLQGGGYGFIGALLAALPLAGAVGYMNNFLAYLGFSPNEAISGYVSTLLLLMGLLVGAGGAAVAVRKHLHV